MSNLQSWYQAIPRKNLELITQRSIQGTGYNWSSDCPDTGIEYKVLKGAIKSKKDYELPLETKEKTKEEPSKAAKQKENSLQTIEVTRSAIR